MQSTTPRYVFPNADADDVDPFQKYMRCLQHNMLPIGARCNILHNASAVAMNSSANNTSVTSTEKPSFETILSLPVPDDFWTCPVLDDHTDETNALDISPIPLFTGSTPPSAAGFASIDNSTNYDDRHMQSMLKSMLEFSTSSPLFDSSDPVSGASLSPTDESSGNDDSVFDVSPIPLVATSVSPSESGPGAVKSYSHHSPSLSLLSTESSEPSDLTPRRISIDTARAAIGAPLSSAPPQEGAPPISFSAESSGGQPSDTKRTKITPFHEKMWTERLEELRIFHREHGHCLVPHSYPPNQQLARWVKRQRRQHKLLEKDGGHEQSTMTAERAALLNDMGFAWERHEVAWMEKMQELREFKAKHGNDVAVPRRSQATKSLALWVKCQKKQFRLFKEGKACSTSAERIVALEKAGFR